MKNEIERLQQNLILPENWLVKKQKDFLSAEEARKKLSKIESEAASKYEVASEKYLKEGYGAMAAMFQFGHLYYAFRVGKVLLSGYEQSGLREKVCAGFLHIMAAYAQKENMDQFETIVANHSANQALRETKIDDEKKLTDTQHFMLGAVLVIGNNSLKNSSNLLICETIVDSALYARELLINRGESHSPVCIHFNNMLVDAAAACLDLPDHQGDDFGGNTLAHIVRRYDVQTMSDHHFDELWNKLCFFTSSGDNLLMSCGIISKWWSLIVRRYDVQTMSDHHFDMIPQLINKLSPELVKKHNLQRFQNFYDTNQQPKSADHPRQEIKPPFTLNIG